MQINFQTTDIYYFIIGCVFASVLFMFYISKLKHQVKSVKRQFEKKSIGMDDSSLKIKTLENKIKTLEAALKKQMENNN